MAESRGTKRPRAQVQRFPDGVKINTWVLVVPSTKHIKRADKAASQIPALVTMVTEEFAKVAYPNPLTLLHGFKGQALMTKQVPLECLRPCKSNSAELELLETKLLEAVMAKVSASCIRTEPTENQSSPSGASAGLHKASTVAEPVAVVDALQKVGAMELQEDELQIVEQADVLQQFDAPSGGAVSVTLATIDDELSTPAPCTPTQPHLRRLMHSPVKDDARPLSGERLQLFTKTLARAFANAKNQPRSPKRLTKKEVAAELAAEEFSAGETCAGLAQLDAVNKICVLDELVFRV